MSVYQRNKNFSKKKRSVAWRDKNGCEGDYIPAFFATVHWQQFQLQNTSVFFMYRLKCSFRWCFESPGPSLRTRISVNKPSFRFLCLFVGLGYATSKKKRYQLFLTKTSLRPAVARRFGLLHFESRPVLTVQYNQHFLTERSLQYALQ